MATFDYRDLRVTWNFVRASMRDKYLGTSLGSLWGIANPLMMLATFTFVFGFVYKVRLPGSEMPSPLAYAIWLISGYGPWISISESIIAASASVVGASGIVKNLAIKLEILPLASALTGLLPLFVSLAFLVALMLADGHPPSWHALLLPLLIVLQAMLVVAIGFLVAALTVFFRDLSYALPNLLTVVLFATPIFYPIDSMPRILKLLSAFNPFYILANAYRETMIYHRVPDPLGLVYVAAFALVLGTATLFVFRRLKGFFEAAL